MHFLAFSEHMERPINFLEVIGIGSQQILFTDFSFIFVSVYIFIPFMILPIFNALDKIESNID